MMSIFEPKELRFSDDGVRYVARAFMYPPTAKNLDEVLTLSIFMVNDPADSKFVSETLQIVFHFDTVLVNICVVAGSICIFGIIYCYTRRFSDRFTEEMS
jgi:hypothetical protein